MDCFLIFYGEFLEYPWERLDYSLIDYSDGIVVLSGGGISLPPVNKKIIEWHDPDRFLAGINLYKSKKSSRLIFTGGNKSFNFRINTRR